MTDLSQLPHLLKLLDDESAEIRDHVLKELESYGDALPSAVEALDEPPSESARHYLEPLLRRLQGSPMVQVDRAFFPGQLVKHSRYGYRGVVVGFDLSCQADDSWYQANRTQPDRSQPWYHVLVDGSTQVTYAAQSSLQPDDASKPIRHPMVNMFFNGFSGDHYDRNDHPWPFS